MLLIPREIQTNVHLLALDLIKIADHGFEALSWQLTSLTHPENLEGSCTDYVYLSITITLRKRLAWVCHSWLDV